MLDSSGINVLPGHHGLAVVELKQDRCWAPIGIKRLMFRYDNLSLQNQHLLRSVVLQSSTSTCESHSGTVRLRLADLERKLRMLENADGLSVITFDLWHCAATEHKLLNFIFFGILIIKIAMLKLSRIYFWLSPILDCCLVFGKIFRIKTIILQ